MYLHDSLIAMVSADLCRGEAPNMGVLPVGFILLALHRVNMFNGCFKFLEKVVLYIWGYQDFVGYCVC